MDLLRLRSWVQVTVNAGACILASSRWEPALPGRPSPSEARLGCMSIVILLDFEFTFSLLHSIFDFYKATGLAGLCSYVTEFAITFDHKVIHQHALAKT